MVMRSLTLESNEIVRVTNLELGLSSYKLT